MANRILTAQTFALRFGVTTKASSRALSAETFRQEFPIDLMAKCRDRLKLKTELARAEIGQIVVGTTSAHSRALHADFGILPQPSQALVRNAHAALRFSRHTPLIAAARAGHPGLPGHQQRQAEAIYRGEDHRRHPRQHREVFSVNF